MDSLRGTREAPGRHQGGRKGLIGQPARHSEQERTLWTACEAPGRHQGGRKGSSWTAREAPGRYQGGREGPFGQPGRHQGGRKGLIGQPARHQGGTSEAGKDYFGQPGRHQEGTREAGKDHLDSQAAPGRQERTNWTACKAPSLVPSLKRKIIFGK